MSECVVRMEMSKEGCHTCIVPAEEKSKPPKEVQDADK